MSIEIWKDVVGYEGLYLVSNMGDIKCLRKNVIKKRSTNPNQYEAVSLVDNNRIRKSYTRHRIVCVAFLENKEMLPIVNHKNNIKNDNRLENLEWCSYQYNIIHHRQNFYTKKVKEFIPKVYSDEWHTLVQFREFHNYGDHMIVEYAKLGLIDKKKEGYFVFYKMRAE